MVMSKAGRGCFRLPVIMFIFVGVNLPPTVDLTQVNSDGTLPDEQDEKRPP